MQYVGVTVRIPEGDLCQTDAEKCQFVMGYYCSLFSMELPAPNTKCAECRAACSAEKYGENSADAL